MEKKKASRIYHCSHQTLPLLEPTAILLNMKSSLSPRAAVVQDLNPDSCEDSYRRTLQCKPQARVSGKPALPDTVSY